MKPGIHIVNDDGDDEFAAMPPAEREAELRANIAAHKARRAADAARPKTIGDIDTAAVYAKFNARKSKTLADGDA